MADAASLKRYASSALRTAVTVDASRLRTQRSATDGRPRLASRGSYPSRFESTSRDAFQTLLAKFRYPSTRSSDTRISRPWAARAAIVKRNASVPYLSVIVSGSATFPFDLDI